VAARSGECLLIEIRRLGELEYHKLAHVDDGFIPQVDKSIAVIAENEHHIIGRIFLVAPVHAEGVFVEEPWRGGTVLKRLVEAAELEARAEGITKLLCYAKDAKMENYIQRLGYKHFPVTVWEKGLI